MKKPHKLYRSLGGKRSTAGAAFAMTFHPVRTLRSAFGWDRAANDIAEGFNMAPTRHAFQLVMSTLKSWGQVYKGPKLSWMFRMLASQPRKQIDTRSLKLD
jgi:hypothetical protein